MFKELSIKNFRGIENLVVEPLNKINVFVGDNCVGKTTILDAIFIAINPNNPRLILNTNSFRNIEELSSGNFISYFNNLNISKNIIIELKDNKKSRLIKIKPITSMTDDIDSENENKKSINKNDKSSTNMEYFVRGFKNNFSVGGNKYESKVVVQYGELNRIDIKQDSKYTSDLNGRYLHQGSIGNNNLVAALSSIIKENKKKKVIEILNNFQNTIEDINIIENNVIKVQDKNLEIPIDINLCGSGLAKSFYIVASFLSKSNNILVIDEIENGLHYSKQKMIWSNIMQLIKESDKQIFIATHSSEMLKSLYNVGKEKNELSLMSLFRLERDKNNKINCINYSKGQFENAIELNIETR